jgi:H+/gluconate symporter-like permease
MSVLTCIASLAFLIFMAYRGFSVILFAPIAALLAVMLTDPTLVPTTFSGVFMDKMAGFLKIYFPVFMLGAVFGKVIEISGFSRSIVAAVIRVIGKERAMLSLALVCAILVYGGVTVFVVVFAVYPFAAETFRQSNIPKRLIPATIALGAFTFATDALPGSPQIQNLIPTTFFGTTTWSGPVLGIVGSILILSGGLVYLEWRRRVALANEEGYGLNHINEPELLYEENLSRPLVAIVPLAVVICMNVVFTRLIPIIYGPNISVTFPGISAPININVASVNAVWAVEGALVLGIIAVCLLAFRPIRQKFGEATKVAIGGALLASVNTASEYGFGAVIATLPGFVVIAAATTTITNPLINEAVSIITLSGITGSASGGLSIALGAMAESFLAAAKSTNIPLEVLHRVAAMASGGMDTLPHNGTIITLLAVTGLTHRQAYGDIFAITCIKTSVVFVVIALFYITGWI